MDIKQYITEELDSPAAAENTLKNIRMLETQPFIGTPLSSVVNIDTHYRFLVCGSYLAFYYVENDDVFIVRILYGRRDYIKILFGDSSNTH